MSNRPDGNTYIQCDFAESLQRTGPELGNWGRNQCNGQSVSLRQKPSQYKQDPLEANWNSAGSFSLIGLLMMYMKKLQLGKAYLRQTKSLRGFQISQITTKRGRACPSKSGFSQSFWNVESHPQRNQASNSKTDQCADRQSIKYETHRSNWLTLGNRRWTSAFTAGHISVNVDIRDEHSHTQTYLGIFVVEHTDTCT